MNAVKLFIIVASLIFSITEAKSEIIKDPGKYADSTEVKKDTVKHNRRFFVDKNGDGYNDNAPDHDNDGIPNGLDKDYKGKKFRWGRKFNKQGSISKSPVHRPRFRYKDNSSSKLDSLKPNSRNKK